VEEELCEKALKQVGVKCVIGGNDPQNGFDCSGLIQYIFKKQGINIPRTSFEQYDKSKEVKFYDIEKGDLVFNKDKSHVGIYIGNNEFIHAPMIGENVKVSKLLGSDMKFIKRINRNLKKKIGNDIGLYTYAHYIWNHGATLNELTEYEKLFYIASMIVCKEEETKNQVELVKYLGKVFEKSIDKQEILSLILQGIVSGLKEDYKVEYGRKTLEDSTYLQITDRYNNKELLRLKLSII
jgi:hypothetical protein